MKRKPFVYVAGPISTGGDIIGNTRRGIRVAEDLRKAGFVPFSPHLSVITEILTDVVSWEDWLDYDEQVILRCDAMFRMKGESRGAEREVAFAKAHGIPVFYAVESMIAWKREYEAVNA